MVRSEASRLTAIWTQDENVSAKHSAAGWVWQAAKKLPNGDNPDPVLSGHLDQVEVAFEIVISRHQVPRSATDRCFQDLIIIGIATDFDLAGSLDNHRAGYNQPDKCLTVFAGIPELFTQSWPFEDFGNFAELEKRRNDAEIAALPTVNYLSGRAGRLQKRRDPNVGVKQSDERHDV